MLVLCLLSKSLEVMLPLARSALADHLLCCICAAWEACFLSASFILLLAVMFTTFSAASVQHGRPASCVLVSS